MMADAAQRAFKASLKGSVGTGSTRRRRKTVGRGMVETNSRQCLKREAECEFSLRGEPAAWMGGVGAGWQRGGFVGGDEGGKGQRRRRRRRRWR